MAFGAKPSCNQEVASGRGSLQGRWPPAWRFLQRLERAVTLARKCNHACSSRLAASQRVTASYLSEGGG